MTTILQREYENLLNSLTPNQQAILLVGNNEQSQSVKDNAQKTVDKLEQVIILKMEKVKACK